MHTSLCRTVGTETFTQVQLTNPSDSFQPDKGLNLAWLDRIDPFEMCHFRLSYFNTTDKELKAYSNLQVSKNSVIQAKLLQHFYNLFKNTKQ